MRKTAITILLTLLTVLGAQGENRGIPFIRNYSAREYNAHNRNYDIACDKNGTVYVANFEGLLYYDGSTWRKIHTPGISRVTRLALGKDGRVWIGGHKVFGYLKADDMGRLSIHSIVSDKKAPSFDEVDFIKITPTRVYVHTLDGRAYYVKNDKQLVPLRSITPQSIMDSTSDSVSNVRLGSFTVTAPLSGGLLISDATRRRTITEADGLCSNSINFITYNNNDAIWGATEHGIFAMEVPSPYSHVTEGQGLHGDVYAIQQLGDVLYIGSLHGLYSLDNGKLTKLPGINLACWQLRPDGDNALLAATSAGLWRVTAQGQHRITDTNTLSVIPDSKGGYITGEVDGLYRVSAGGQRSLLVKVEKVTGMSLKGRMLRAETIFGEVWNVDVSAVDKRTLVRSSFDVMEPKLEVIDALGRKWITDCEGKDISLVAKTEGSAEIAKWTRPLAQKTLNAIFCNAENSLWVGGDFGVINCDLAMLTKMGKKTEKEKVYIRQVVTVGDSVLWGGYDAKTMAPRTEVDDIELPPSARMLTIYFSTASNSIFAPPLYRYRINGRQWTKWREETLAHLANMAPGNSLVEIQAMDGQGNISETAKVSVYVGYPYYMRWWAVLLYVVVALFLIRSFFIYRTNKLERAKKELEEEVAVRTSELSKKTAELSTALDDLQRTQADLVRIERTATAGKLTQGLIDRILNPLNYINNFAKLTNGLAKDLREDIEDEQENMSEDNYEDCQDILDMMSQNLGKIEEHGVNTTRTLRAMEAMLNNHVGTLRETDMVSLCKQAVSVMKEYHKDSIAQCNINVIMELPDAQLMHKVDADSIHNVLLALMTNSVYAVTKKYQRCAYGAEVVLKLASIGDRHVEIRIVDNGIGIEETIIAKVFDPFFTTKTTGEAAGVGLYLAREIIQDHNGTIAIKSEKDQYTEITINI